MIEIKNIKDNLNCIASITIKVINTTCTIKIDGDEYRISKIFHTPNKT